MRVEGQKFAAEVFDCSSDCEYGDYFQDEIQVAFQDQSNEAHAEKRQCERNLVDRFLKHKNT